MLSQLRKRHLTTGARKPSTDEDHEFLATSQAPEVVEHRPDCPRSQDSVVGDTACTCDYGERLAAFLIEDEEAPEGLPVIADEPVEQIAAQSPPQKRPTIHGKHKP